jgi:GNAT superfamily N-acetyltransferase
VHVQLAVRRFTAHKIGQCPITIRALELADLDALLSLYTQLHPNDETLPARSVVDRIWRAILADPAQIYLGGFTGERLVCACHATVILNLTRGARPYAVIENVVTDGTNRRRGWGANVMHALIDRCWERDCYKIMLMSGVARSEVHAFYEALGFDRTSKQAFVLNRPAHA